MNVKRGFKIFIPERGEISLLTPAVPHIDKIHKRMGIKVVFTQSIIEYHIHGETCVCCLTISLSRDSNQGLRYEYI